jgi:mannose-6-phosphate isomerase-like protein (cupin superfamily)
MNRTEIFNKVKDAKANGQIIFLGKVFKVVPNWETFYNIFKQNLELGAIDFSSPGTLAMDNSEDYTKDLDLIIDNLKSFHPGTKIAALSIVHFLSANDNAVPEAARAFSEDFMRNNPIKLPPDFDFNLFQPTIHSDPVDGFYVQCKGQTTWRAYYKDRTDEYLTNPGDLLYIPKGVEHSVESMNVRAAISVSFFDE